MAKIKNLIFDLGGVLCDLDFKASLSAYAALGFNMSNLKVESEKPDNIYLKLEVGEATEDDLCKELCRMGKQKTASKQQLLDAWNKMLLGIPVQRKEALNKLKDRYKLFLLSNCNIPHWSYIVEHFSDYRGEDIWKWFDKLFL